MIRIFAVSGWAVPPNWFQRTLEQEIRDCSVLAIYPYTSNRYEESVKSLEEASVDIYMGYSLGSLWLQKHRHLIPQDALVCHLAPVLAYPLEKGRGGKIARGRLDYLKKWIRRHPDSLELVLEFLESNKIFCSR